VESSDAPLQIFRREALERYGAGFDHYADVLWTPHRWLRGSFWLLLGVVLLGAGFICFARFNEYAAGPCVIRAGQASGGFRAVIALPGEYRPLLKPEQPARLEVTGFSHAYQNVQLESVANQIVGPDQAQRVLGTAQALPASIVLANAALAGNGFSAEGALYDYYDGMRCTVQARVRTRSVLAMLLPWVRGLREPGT
jgi:hypothetical protein